jgi:hypothetical protein
MALSDSAAIAKDLGNEGQLITQGKPWEDVARVLAQWAINVVAYRDNNNVMIPFPYDPNPFSGNGWNPPADTPVSKSPTYTQHTVWGCKRPDLLITETLAFHDRRTEDRNDEIFNSKDPTKLNWYVNNYGIPTYSRTAAGFTTAAQSSGKRDPGFNSRFRPQGSLFVELYNPWTIREPRTTDLSYVDPTTKIAGIQLNKTTPTLNGNTSPIWRLVIVDPSVQTPSTNGDEFPDPDNPIVANRPTIERVAYFVSLTGGTATVYTPPGDAQVKFSLSATNAMAKQPFVVNPGGYAVVGSGNSAQNNRTFIGFQTGQTTGNPGTTRMVSLNTADLTDARVVRNTLDPAPPAGTPIPKVLPIDFPQRLSVSEPTGGYAKYEIDANRTQQTPSAANDQYPVTLDIPVDMQRSVVSQEVFKGVPIFKWLNNDGTIPAFRIIYLQRLADPTRPFVADNAPGATPQQWNPYRTIDAMAVDLTTFNGVSTAADPTATKGATLAGVSTALHFETHQRGEKNHLPLATATEMDIWKQEPGNKSTLTPPGWSGSGSLPSASNMCFSASLSQTLGYLNKPFAPPAGAPTTALPGDSQYPFPWLNWSYRPFNSVYELLLVPTVSSSRLLARSTTFPRRYFGYADGAVRAQTNPPGSYQPQPVYDGSTSTQVPYPHLMNFFESSQSSKAGVASQLHRLFAYVGVPSRFANAQLQMRPDMAGSNADPAHLFHTPFNRVSRYREAGLINFNTVTSPDVLFGAMNMYVKPLQVNSQLNPMFWDKFVRSRRGDGANIGATDGSKTLDWMLRITGSAPSRFMRPYRTPGGAFLSAPNVSGASTEATRETDVTLFRCDPDVLTNSGSAERPLFEIDDYLLGTGTSAVGATPDKFSMACTDFNRNPYFRYQAMQKLGSVISNHSNVFAIWITEGYFEVTPASNPKLKDAYGNLVYPDGYQLGQELGSDTGDIVRHRAFYIFDRSIPVGFVRGHDINQDKATLLKRFIE